MKNSLLVRSLRTLSVSMILTLSSLSMASMAHEYTLGDIEVLHPYAPPTPPGVGMAAGYLEITNHGQQDDRLVGGTVVFADEVQIHQTVVENDVSRMRQLHDGVVIPAGATVKIEPMGIHLMFTGLAEPLVEGVVQPVTLLFERAGELNVEFVIEHPSNESMESSDESGMQKGVMKDHGMKHQ